MIAFVIQTAIFVVALIAVIRFFVARFEAAEHAWTQERSLLLTRIQHPERVIHPTAEWEYRPPRRDGLGQVGRIDLSEPGQKDFA